MKTDRELLEAAAKAAGLAYVWRPYGGHIERHCGPLPWNPLEDDGDALRLAVKLKLDIYTGMGCDGSITTVRMPSEYNLESVFAEHLVDADVATRRAIVRAAAAIGEACP